MGSKAMFLTDRFLWAWYMTVIRKRVCGGETVGKLLVNNSSHLTNIGKTVTLLLLKVSAFNQNCIREYGTRQLIQD